MPTYIKQEAEVPEPVVSTKEVIEPAVREEPQPQSYIKVIFYFI